MDESQDWLTTEQAAEKMGLSAPYVVVLLNSAEFNGQVIITDEYFVVKAAAVNDWMKMNSVNNPPSEEDEEILKWQIPEIFFDDEGLQQSIVDDTNYQEILKRRQEMLKNRPVK